MADREALATRELPLGRLEAFSDGVFAIAITLLVLELGVAAGNEDRLLEAVLDQWPSYLAYVTSFLTIGVIWMQHSEIVATLRTADATLYRLNLLVLLLASFLPFPTKLVAEYIGEQSTERVAVTFYGLVLLGLSLAVLAFVRYAAENPRLVKHDTDATRVEEALTHTPGIVLYVVGIIVGLLAPTAGVILYLVSSAARGLPSSTLRRVLWRREPRSPR